MRIDQLTFTRFIAALSIVIYHFGNEITFINNDSVGFIFNQANVGVSYFFVLSGFVMIIAYHERQRLNFGEFILNRIGRIYPAYLLAIFCLFAIDLFRNINYTDLVYNLLLIQTWIPGKAMTINYPGWSLSVEFFFYAIFPFLFNFIYRRTGMVKVAFWIILFWIISQVYINYLSRLHLFKIPFYQGKDLLYHPLFHLNAFLTGNLAGLFYTAKMKEKRGNYLLVILLLLALLILLLKFRFNLRFHNGFLAIVFVPFILVFSASNDIVSRLFRKKIFRFLGDISYGIYILQVPVWVTLSDFRMTKYLSLEKDKDFALSFFIRLSVLILAAALSHRYFEEPLRMKIRSLYKSGTQKS